MIQSIKEAQKLKKNMKIGPIENNKICTFLSNIDLAEGLILGIHHCLNKR